MFVTVVGRLRKSASARWGVGGLGRTKNHGERPCDVLSGDTSLPSNGLAAGPGVGKISGSGTDSGLGGGPTGFLGSELSGLTDTGPGGATGAEGISSSCGAEFGVRAGRTGTGWYRA
jgi:hypothetical protein